MTIREYTIGARGLNLEPAEVCSRSKAATVRELMLPWLNPDSKTRRESDSSEGSELGTLKVGLAVLILQSAPSLLAQASWPMFGQNPANTAYNSAETTISPSNVSSLKTKWKFTTGGDVSARAAVVNGVVYFPDWGGNMWALNASTGTVIWSHQISDYGLAAGTVSRTSPAVANGIVYIGTQYVAPATSSSPQPPTGWLLAINATTGALVWKMQPDTSNPFPVITSSPIVGGGVVYVGMTSNEENAAANPTYPCCSARGNVVAVNAATGAELWQTFTVPSGYTGGAVWASNAVLDTARGLLYVGTGNNYSVPTDPAYTECISDGGTRATCQSPNNHGDSILALEMTTGAVAWGTRLENWDQIQSEGVKNGSDDTNVGCSLADIGIGDGGFGNCPLSPGPDYDFGSDPNEITYNTPSGSVTILGAGQKSGIYYALNPDTGDVLWHTQVGPGSYLGGIEWGSASDGTRIYVAIANVNGVPYAAGRAGSWSALNPVNGEILWQIADPNHAGWDYGPMTVANGVVYAESMGGLNSTTAPTMFALNAATGATLWSYVAGASVNAGASVVNGVVYWGSGYGLLSAPIGTGGNQTFYAFSINGQ